MFVAKSELINTKQLIRIKMKGTLNSGLRNFSIIVGIIFLFNMILALVSLFGKSNGAEISSWQDYSIWYSFGLVVGILVLNCTYRQSNREYEVYPQTNTSRFLSVQVTYHIWIVIISSMLLAMYLIQYGLVSIIASIGKNIHMVYNFDIRFMISGFFVLIIYLSIIIGIISFTATLLRKFRIYAAVFFILITAFIIANIQDSIAVFKKAFGFLIFEKSVWLFIIKGILVWVLLFIVSLIINKYTVYYRNSFRMSKVSITGIAVVVFIAIMCIGFISARISNQGSDGGNMTNNSNGYEHPVQIQGQVEFDISGLPDGTKINVVTSNDIGFVKDDDKVVSSGSYNNVYFFEYEDGSKAEYTSEYIIYKENDNLQSVTGQKLMVEYYYPLKLYDSKDISSFINPKFNAWMEGDTLYLDYTYDKNIKAVFMPMWSFMWQFDYFKGKDIFKDQLETSYANWGGHVFIEVE